MVSGVEFLAYFRESAYLIQLLRKRVSVLSAGRICCGAEMFGAFTRPPENSLE